MTFEHICEFFCEITYLFFFERRLIGDVEVGTDRISDLFISNIRSDIKSGVRISGKLAHPYLMRLQRAEIKKNYYFAILYSLLCSCCTYHSYNDEKAKLYNIYIRIHIFIHLVSKWRLTLEYSFSYILFMKSLK